MLGHFIPRFRRALCIHAIDTPRPTRGALRLPIVATQLNRFSMSYHHDQGASFHDLPCVHDKSRMPGMCNQRGLKERAV